MQLSLTGLVVRLLEGFSSLVQTFMTQSSLVPRVSALLILTLYFLFLAYAAYFLAACILDFHRALALFVLTCLVLLVLVHHFLKRLFGEKLTRCLRPLENSRLKFWMKW